MPVKLHLLFSKVLSLILTFLLSVIIGQKYGAEFLGNYIYGCSLTIVLSYIYRFGTANSLVRFGSVLYDGEFYTKTRLLFYHTFYWVLIISSFFTLSILITLYVFEDSLYNLNILYLTPFIIAGPINAVTIMLSSLLKVVERPDMLAYFQTVVLNFITITYVLVSIILENEIGFSEISILYLCSNIFSLFALLLYLILKRYLNLLEFIRSFLSIRVNLNCIRDYSLFSFLIIDLVSLFSHSGIFLIIGSLLSSTDFALFAVAHKFSALISYSLVVVNSFIVAPFAKAFAVKDIEKLKRLSCNSSGFAVLLSLPVTLIYLIFPDVIVSLFGTDFSTAYPLLLILMISQHVYLFTGISQPILSMTNQQKILSIYSILFFILHILFIYYASKLHGLHGAVIAYSLIFCFKYILLYIKAWKILGFFVLPRFSFKSLA